MRSSRNRSTDVGYHPTGRVTGQPERLPAFNRLTAASRVDDVAPLRNGGRKILADPHYILDADYKRRYRHLLATNPSPQSKAAPRQQEIPSVDLASASQALVKVRVRIDTILYTDYLCFHLIDAGWLVTAKSFHIESRFVD